MYVSLEGGTFPHLFSSLLYMQWLWKWIYSISWISAFCQKIFQKKSFEVVFSAQVSKMWFWGIFTTCFAYFTINGQNFFLKQMVLERGHEVPNEIRTITTIFYESLISGGSIVKPYFSVFAVYREIYREKLNIQEKAFYRKAAR